MELKVHLWVCPLSSLVDDRQNRNMNETDVFEIGMFPLWEHADLSLFLSLSVSLSQTHTHTRVMLDQDGMANCNTLTAHCNALQSTATHWNVLECTATHCNAPQRTSMQCNALQCMRGVMCSSVVRGSAVYCNVLQRVAVCCCVLLCVAMHCNACMVQCVAILLQCVAVCRFSGRSTTNLLTVT